MRAKFYTAVLILFLMTGGAVLGSLVVPSSLDFGIVQNRTVVTKQIAIINNSETRIEGIHIDSSCDCLSVISAPEEILPNRPGVFTVRFAPRKVGLANIDLLIRTKNSKKPSNALISIQAEIRDAGERAPGPIRNRSGITASDALKQKNHVFIDIRNGSRYKAAHISKSINLSLFSIKTQEFLKDRSIVLVDEGITPMSGVEQEIEKLEKAGFSSIYYLEGGFQAWRAAGGKIEGRSVQDAMTLGLDLLGEIERNPQWDLALISGNLDQQALVDKLKQKSAPYSFSGRQLLVIAADRGQYQQLKVELSNLILPVWYLDGNLTDWTQYHSHQIAPSPQSKIVIGSLEPGANPIRFGKGSGPCHTCH